MIKAGIIGCGKIADHHAEQILYNRYARLAAVYDNEPLMAKQLAERFNANHAYSDLDKMLSETDIDVAHITTPPQSHFILAKKCLKAGKHVYIEKPFTVHFDEAEQLIELAKEKGKLLTVGHSAQFSPAAQEMRKMVAQGALGGEPMHLESYYCYNLADARYAKSLLGDKNHWVRKLPGNLLHNIISHGISKIVEFLPEEHVTVIAHGFTSNFLSSLEEHEIIDELRTIIRSGQTTAYFTFSTQIKPALHGLHLYGPSNSLFEDDDMQTVILAPGQRAKSYLNYIGTPGKYAKQYLHSARNNIMRFLRSDFGANPGIAYIVNTFYKAILGECNVPIPYREILLTSKIMDDIFRQLKNR